MDGDPDSITSGLLSVAQHVEHRQYELAPVALAVGIRGHGNRLDGQRADALWTEFLAGLGDGLEHRERLETLGLRGDEAYGLSDKAIEPADALVDCVELLESSWLNGETTELAPQHS